jgi:hypothetical protein
MNIPMNRGKISSSSRKMTRSLILVLAVAIQLSIVLVGISQSASAQVDEAFDNYENPGFGLTLTYPPNWTVDELRTDPAAQSNNSIVAIFKSPSQGPNDKYLENVIINVQGPRPDIASLETYTSNSVKAFTNMSDTIKITEQGEDTLAGLPAHQLLYTSTGIPGLNLEKMQVFTVLNNNTAYVVTYGAEQAEYDKNLQNVDRMINSIKIDRNAMANDQDGEEEEDTT